MPYISVPEVLSGWAHLGISRFDGYAFQTYSWQTEDFLHDDIWRILEDANVWFWLLPQPPFQDFDIWHPITGAHTTFREKFGLDIPLPKAHPYNWLTANQKLLALQDSNRLFCSMPVKIGYIIFILKIY